MEQNSSNGSGDYVEEEIDELIEQFMEEETIKQSSTEREDEEICLNFEPAIDLQNQLQMPASDGILDFIRSVHVPGQEDTIKCTQEDANSSVAWEAQMNTKAQVGTCIVEVENRIQLPQRTALRFSKAGAKQSVLKRAHYGKSMQKVDIQYNLDSEGKVISIRRSKATDGLNTNENKPHIKKPETQQQIPAGMLDFIASLNIPVQMDTKTCAMENASSFAALQAQSNIKPHEGTSAVDLENRSQLPQRTPLGFSEAGYKRRALKRAYDVQSMPEVNIHYNLDSEGKITSMKHTNALNCVNVKQNEMDIILPAPIRQDMTTIVPAPGGPSHRTILLTSGGHGQIFSTLAPGDHGQISSMLAPGGHGQISSMLAPGGHGQISSMLAPGGHGQRFRMLAPGGHGQISSMLAPGGHSQISSMLATGGHGQISNMLAPGGHGQRFSMLAPGGQQTQKFDLQGSNVQDGHLILQQGEQEVVIEISRQAGSLYFGDNQEIKNFQLTPVSKDGAKK